MDKNDFKIVLSGGGTGGSVSPLLAIFLELQKDKEKKYDFLWIGTDSGPEREMVEKHGIFFRSICAGKLRRYWSWKNLTDIFFIKVGFLQSLFILTKYRPNIILSAGSFTSVPVAFAAWFLRIPIIIHQQDAIAGLANKIMAPLAKVVTVTFEKSLNDFGSKAIWTGNPTRFAIPQKGLQNLFLGAGKDRPTVLIMGGGTGSEAINNLVIQSAAELTKFCQILHITGKNKTGLEISEYYTAIDFLDTDGMSEAYRLADIVVSRAGMGSLTEIAYFGKPSILIPIPESHQLANAQIFASRDAALVYDQESLTPSIFTQILENLIGNSEERLALIMNIGKVMKTGANIEITKIIKEIIEK